GDGIGAAAPRLRAHALLDRGAAHAGPRLALAAPQCPPAPNSRARSLRHHPLATGAAAAANRSLHRSAGYLPLPRLRHAARLAGADGPDDPRPLLSAGAGGG